MQSPWPERHKRAPYPDIDDPGQWPESHYYYLAVVLWAALVFLLIGWGRIFPALYGDEYGSLIESHDLTTNLHAVAYFGQLAMWRVIAGGDSWLRLLSILWGAVTLLGCWKLGAASGLSRRITWYWCGLLATNTFFLQYATQVRFYSLFLAASVLFFWRLIVFHQGRTRHNLIWLGLSSALLVTSHLFGWLVLAIGCMIFLWWNLNGTRWVWPLTAVSVAVISALVVVKPIRTLAVRTVYLATAHHTVPEGIARGLTLAMIAKIPVTFYYFILGEHVYPLWWWISLPALLVMSIGFVMGLHRLRAYLILAPIAWLVLASVPMMYLVFDPLAPPTLQGAAPRYLVFVLPIFWAILALGASGSRIVAGGLVGTQVIALVFLLFSSWSASGGDLVDWPSYLETAIIAPARTCLVIDGRSRGPVERYAPDGVRVVSDLDACLGYDRVLLISSDYRLSMVRHFDGWAARLAAQGYALVTNITQFPAQITVYRRSPNSGFQVPPARLGLPEQDLRLPMPAEMLGWQLQGFVRLDSQTPSYRGPASLLAGKDVYLVSNYRATAPIAQGTPVLSLTWLGASGQREEIVLRAGIETAAWDGMCEICEGIVTWPKRLHLVGAQAYPGAYRHYRVTIWGTSTVLPSWPVREIKVVSLLSEGTVYFWGVYPASIH